MGGSYIIAGRAVKNEYLTLATLFGVGGITYLSTRGGGKAKHDIPKSEPAVNASSKEEEDFIKNFIAEAEKESGSKH